MKEILKAECPRCGNNNEIMKVKGNHKLVCDYCGCYFGVEVIQDREGGFIVSQPYLPNQREDNKPDLRLSGLG